MPIGKLVAGRIGVIWRKWIGTSLVATACATSGGCFFYTDSVNQEPTAQIHKETAGTHHIGDVVTLSAHQSDDDDDRSELIAVWRAIQCEDEEGTVCPPGNEIKIDDGDIFAEFAVTLASKLPVLVILRVKDRRDAYAEDYVLVNFDLSAIRGMTVSRARLRIAEAGADLIRVGVSTVAAPWTGGGGGR